MQSIMGASYVACRFKRFRIFSFPPEFHFFINSSKSMNARGITTGITYFTKPHGLLYFWFFARFGNFKNCL